MKGFMHVNGVTYDVGPQQSESALSQLEARLGAKEGTQRQVVFLDGQRVELTIDLAGVWASAVWVEAENSTVAVASRR